MIAYELRRVAQTRRIFANWPVLLRKMVGQRVGRGSPQLEFVTRDGVRLACPNLPGARLPMYEQFADDCYERDWVLGSDGALRVLDVGSHVGAFAVNLAIARPDVRVECYEPSPESARYLAAKHRDERSGPPRASARMRVGGRGRLGDARRQQFGERAQRPGAREPTPRRRCRFLAGAACSTVETTTFDRAVADAGGSFDVVKMDCEGGEYELIYASTPENWMSVRRVVLEYHPVDGESWDELQYLVREGRAERRAPRVEQPRTRDGVAVPLGHRPRREVADVRIAFLLTGMTGYLDAQFQHLHKLGNDLLVVSPSTPAALGEAMADTAFHGLATEEYAQVIGWETPPEPADLVRTVREFARTRC